MHQSLTWTLPTHHIQDEIANTVYNLEEEHASVVNMDPSQHIQAEIVNIVITTVLKKHIHM